MLRRLRRAIAACPPALGLAALLAVAAPNLGCGQTACFQWSPVEGSCPNRDKARTFFGNCNDIESIDDDGKAANNLCCYAVTKSSGRTNAIDCNDSAVGVGVGAGPPPPFTTGGPAAVTTVSSGVFPIECDQTGFCGDTVSGCIGCALTGPCALSLEACNQSKDCNGYSICVGACAPQAQTCVANCASAHPAGAKLFTAMVDCAICTACPMDCSSMTKMCSGSSTSSASSSGGGGMGGMSSSAGMGGQGGK